MEHYPVRKGILAFVEDKAEILHGTLVDLGCGSSPYKSLLQGSPATRIRRYIRVDLGTHGHHAGNNPDVVWDGHSIPLENASADCFLMTEVLEHVLDIDRVLGEVCRCLRDGGVLVGTMPFFWPLHELPWDYRRLTPEGLRAVAMRAGFAEVVAEKLGGWDLACAQMLAQWAGQRPMRPSARAIFKLMVFPAWRWLLWRAARRRALGKPSDEHMFVGLGFVLRKACAAGVRPTRASMSVSCVSEGLRDKQGG